jgi:hypothetical protein
MTISTRTRIHNTESFLDHAELPSEQILKSQITTTLLVFKSGFPDIPGLYANRPCCTAPKSFGVVYKCWTSMFAVRLTLLIGCSDTYPSYKTLAKLIFFSFWINAVQVIHPLTRNSFGKSLSNLILTLSDFQHILEKRMKFYHLKFFISDTLKTFYYRSCQRERDIQCVYAMKRRKIF